MYTKQQLDRIMELYKQIESKKSNKYSVPTYKDNPALKEISQILLSDESNDKDAISDKITGLFYICKCYDEMCRAGMSSKYYKILLESFEKLYNLLDDDDDYECFKRFEEAVQKAYNARNQYENDFCEDLFEIVDRMYPGEEAEKIFKSAKKTGMRVIKNDPIELSDEYLEVIDEVEELINKNRISDDYHEYWNLKAEYLLERGVEWYSPAQLNPGVLFD